MYQTYTSLTRVLCRNSIRYVCATSNSCRRPKSTKFTLRYSSIAMQSTRTSWPARDAALGLVSALKIAITSGKRSKNVSLVFIVRHVETLCQVFHGRIHISFRFLYPLAWAELTVHNIEACRLQASPSTARFMYTSFVFLEGVTYDRSLSSEFCNPMRWS